MKKLPTFVSGMLTMALIGGLGISALAASGQVAFNVSALSLNGTQVSAKGENYTLANGHSVPASITYTDETGGGTTYLPVRRISELLGVETGWDGVAGAVTVKGEVKAPATPETPKTDYSTWTAEEEKAYQEFKGLWEVTFRGRGTNGPYTDAAYTLVCKTTGTKDELKDLIATAKESGILRRLAEELKEPADDSMWFFCYLYGGKEEHFIGNFSVMF